MYKKYSQFKAYDFLEDTFFVDSMKHPTDESEHFWKQLIQSESIDVDEFIQAYEILKEFPKNKPFVEDHLVDDLWVRINQTNKAKKHKSVFFIPMRYVAAAGVLLVLSVLYFSIVNKSDIEVMQIKDFARENIIHKHDQNNEIKVVSGGKIFAVTGSQVKLEYDQQGNLKVDEEPVMMENKKKVKADIPIYNKLIVPFGKRAFLTLSDGTSLWINAGTTVVYPVTFAKNYREIFVEGEVLADVVRDESRPFVVKTDKLDIQVLGTVFNVTAYKNDDQINVVLVSGTVHVKPENGRATAMSPNQMYTFNENSSTLRDVNVENYISWKDGIYIFRNEAIEDILLRLSRYYNVTMQLPSTPSGINCSGKLELKEDLNQLLNGLSEISSMSYGVQGNFYKIKFN